MGVNYNASIVTSDLTICLDAANRKSYSGTGSTWFDISGNNYNCALTNAPTWNSSGYFVFNGTSNYCSITNSPTINFSTGQTILIVMNHNVTTGRPNPWNQAYGGYGTWTHESGSNINYYYGTAGVDSTPYTNLTSGSTPASTWIAMCCTRSNSVVNWYLNTTNQSTATNPYGVLPNTVGNIQIGLGYTGNYWNGNISMILVYTRALSSNEVAQNFNAVRGRYGI